MSTQLKSEIQQFWNSGPCGSKFTDRQTGTLRFFLSVEKFRYELEPHILEMIDFPALAGKRVVEIGCGLGTDAAQFGKHGASYIGLDLSGNSVALAQKNLQRRGLSAKFMQADAEQLPFASNSVDFVYSHGVLHHTPHIARAVREIHRILRPGGRATVMVYHRHSWNYRGDICVLRRIGALLLFFPSGVKLARKLSGEDAGRLQVHADAIRSQGLRYMFGRAWLDNNTDGAGNPLSAVFSRNQVAELFAAFRSVRTAVRFLHAEKLPLIGKRIPKAIEAYLGRKVGWHLYVHAEK